MSRPADEPTPEGFSKVAGLPMMKYHDECGSVVVDTAAHIYWHEQLKSDVMNASLPQVLI